MTRRVIFSAIALLGSASALAFVPYFRGPAMASANCPCDTCTCCDCGPACDCGSACDCCGCCG
ncbi:MAG: hypothetical protein IPM64_14145 [Phycisphaerales bacterium]|nr:hypothetical protein [Phycisphaerales bacterium]